MVFEFKYAKTAQKLEIPDGADVELLLPNEAATPSAGEEQILRDAMENPIGTARLGGICRRGEKIAIITSDITRPCPSRKILPRILAELRAAGCSMDDVTVVFAVGSHRRHTADEMRRLVGDEVFGSVRCIDSAGDFLNVGTSSFGTPYEVFAPVARADRRICVGNIEYHYFAGYSGGAKAVMPGVCSRSSIQANHSRMVLDEARAGSLDGNPLRRDIDEVAKFCPIDFIVNVVLDPQKKIVCAVAGHHILAHRAGCRFLDSLYSVEIGGEADIVVASPGGFPKDINLYQAQKALDNAKHAVRDGGIVVLCAACPEGVGEGVFERTMTGAKSSEDWISGIQKKFELGAHKAAAIGLVMQKAQVFLASDFDPAVARRMFFRPFESLQAAFDAAYAEKGAEGQPKIHLMPSAGSTLPKIAPR